MSYTSSYNYIGASERGGGISEIDGGECWKLRLYHNTVKSPVPPLHQGVGEAPQVAPVQQAASPAHSIDGKTEY